MTILVAEIGWNFLGKLSLAKKMILEAKKAGSDAVKFQIWDPKYLKNEFICMTHILICLFFPKNT